MSKLSFARDIKCLFAKYINGMTDVPLATNEGVKTLQLGSYDSVKYFYYQIQVAIHGYDFDRAGHALVDEKYLLRDANGNFVTSAPHPMPPEPPQGDGRLPQEAINLFDQWVRDGMLP